jgi:hypothetical protein
MKAYGINPKHRPSPGPRQPKLILEDADTHAERQRCLAILADMGHKAARGEYDHLDRRGCWRWRG